MMEFRFFYTLLGYVFVAYVLVKFGYFLWKMLKWKRTVDNESGRNNVSTSSKH